MGIEHEFIWRVAFAALFGALVGLERAVAGKHAGMRTYALVSMGSALFVVSGIIAAFQFSVFPSINPLHIAGFIVIGIGFIGSGVAAFRGEHGGELTTATGIWVAAGIGMACGFGYYGLALGATILAIIIFTVLLRVENAMRRHFGVQNEQ